MILQTNKQGVNFINVLRTNFSYGRRFSTYFLALLKNSYEKCARKTLMKLTQGSNDEARVLNGLMDIYAELQQEAFSQEFD